MTKNDYQCNYSYDICRACSIQRIKFIFFLNKFVSRYQMGLNSYDIVKFNYLNPNENATKVTSDQIKLKVKS